ncbi:MAG TPA: hypothetical protein VKY27_04245 [Bacteriovoracaceae bacterium]|nr:hypothetical protein [Bacteriovoracaceae bacterium]
MSQMKVLEARCISSEFDQRLQIEFSSDGVITRVGDLEVPRNRLDFYFDDSCLLFAGMGDVHIHAREDVSGQNNYKEDFISTFKAMTNGGLCHCGDMPNNPLPPIDDESYIKKFELTKKAHSAVWPYGGIGPKTKPLSFKIPYKAYMGPSVGELYFKNFEELDSALARYQGQWVSFHCEDPQILELSKEELTHFARRPVSAEVLATHDALKLIEKYQLKGKLCHYSSGEGLKAIREFRKKGNKVLIEVTPQHLYFYHENLEDPHYFQMNPPIRSQCDQQALWDALLKGEIDFLATDHAPHTLEEKQQGVSGLTGLDTYAGFVCWLISQKVPLTVIAKMCSENPGDFYNEFLPTFKSLSSEHKYPRGYLKEGFRADFTVLNLKETTLVNEAFLKTKVKHSPFLGVTFPGKLEALIQEGRRLV